MRSFRSRTVSSRSLLSQPTVLKLSQPVAPSLLRVPLAVKLVYRGCRFRSSMESSLDRVGLDRYFIPFQHWELNHRPEGKLALV